MVSHAARLIWVWHLAREASVRTDAGRAAMSQAAGPNYLEGIRTGTTLFRLGTSDRGWIDSPPCTPPPPWLPSATEYIDGPRRPFRPFSCLRSFVQPPS